MKQLILGDDPQLRIYGETSIWLKKISFFRRSEDQRLFLQDPNPEDLAIHKSLLRRLIADGDYLLSLMHQIGLPGNVEGITLESIEATVELLRADYRGRHESMSPDKRARILREVFPDWKRC